MINIIIISLNKFIKNLFKNKYIIILKMTQSNYKKIMDMNINHINDIGELYSIYNRLKYQQKLIVTPIFIADVVRHKILRNKHYDQILKLGVHLVTMYEKYINYQATKYTNYTLPIFGYPASIFG